MTKRKTFLLLAVAVIFATACSLTSGAAVLKTPTGTPTASQHAQPMQSPTTSPTRCTVTTGAAGGRLNMRACAGTGCGVIGVLEEGQAVTILAAGDWLKVQTEAGATGFVNSKYCNLLLKTE